MDPRGKRILILGDSLSHRGGRESPDGVTALPLPRSSGSPGDLIGSHLLASGASGVRINGRVSRSAVNLFSGRNGENGAIVLAAEAQLRPDIVVVFLGTNDLGMTALADIAAFHRIKAAFAPQTQFVALGPPSFVSKDLNTKAITVYNTLNTVFGAKNVVDLRPLTADITLPSQGRASDGVHFASQGAALTAQRATAALLGQGHDVDNTTNGVNHVGLFVGATAAALAAVGAALFLRNRRHPTLSGLNGVTVPDGEFSAAVAAVEENPKSAASTKEFVDLFRDTAYELAHHGKAWGPVSGKVFISDVATALGVNLRDHAKDLLVGRQQGWIDLARADLVGAMPPAKVNDSEILSLGSSVHFVNTSAKRPAYTKLVTRDPAVVAKRVTKSNPKVTTKKKPVAKKAPKAIVAKKAKPKAKPKKATIAKKPTIKGGTWFSRCWCEKAAAK